MESIRNAIDRTNEWLIAEFWHTLVGVFVGLVVMSIGVDIAFFLPGRLKASAIAEAATAVETASASVTSAQLQFDAEASWWKLGAGYVDGLQTTITNASDNLTKNSDNADALLAKARTEMNWRKAVALARDAKAKADKANADALGVTKKLNENKQLRSDIRALLLRTSAELLSSGQTYGLVDTRYQGEYLSYASKYTGELETALKYANGQQTGAQAAVDAATLLMPADADVKGNGDPNGAKTQLDKAKASIDDVNTKTAYVTSRLEYLGTADAEAGPKRDIAENDFGDAKSYVDSTNVRTGFWLKDAYGALGQAEYYLKVATEALAKIIERTLVDKPLAYESAMSSSKQSAEAVRLTDVEIALVDAANRAINLISTRVDEVNGYITRAGTAQSTLSAYHASDTWSSVSGNIADANSRVTDAGSAISDARGLMDLSVQRFSDAKQIADTALSGLDTAQGEAQAVIDLASTLEEYRKQYPGAYDSASSKISSESGEVANYGSYDSGAVSDFNEAKRLLSDAASFAASGYYEKACSAANSAYTKASGTGDRAHAAYDRHVAEEEAAKKRAEEAARAAQEAAERAAEEASRPSYGGGGGSDSNYSGGGSDSNYSSSGSDSDY